MKQIGVDGYKWQDAWLASAYYHQEHRDYLANLLQHTSGLYSFEQYMTEVNYKYMMEFIRKNSDEVPKEVERYLMVYCLGGVRYNTEWIIGKVKATPEEMADVYGKTMPESLSQYFQSE